MTFLNPFFLFGTLLVALPILIHLWFRKRLKRIPFSAVRFLKITEARRFGWLRLREWLILAARCLFIVFLFLSLARPNLKSRVFGIGRRSSVFLIVDNSYSMAYGDNFEQMKDLALQVISMYSSNSEFCVVPLCASLNSNGIFWTTVASAKHALDKIQLAYGQAGIGAALSGAPKADAKYDIDYVYVGDGQAVNFRDYRMEAIEQRTLYWIRVSTGGNVGVVNVALKDPVAVPMEEYIVEVALVNYGRRPWSGKVGIASGAYYDEQEGTLQPGAEGRFDFRLPRNAQTGKAMIYDDSLSIDNVYYFHKRLPRSVNVLVVGESPYLAQALGSESDPRSTFLVRTAEQLGAVDLRGYDVVVFDGMQDISESERIRLIDHLRNPGSGLVMILGEGFGPNLVDFLSDYCMVHEPVVPKGYVIVDWIDQHNPIFRIFESSGALRDVQCYGYTKTEAQSGVIARFSGDDPFIVVQDNVAVITAPLNERSTNFVYNRAFVPVVLRLMMSLVQEQQRTEFYVGEEVVQGGLVKAPTGELMRAGEEFTLPGFHSSNGDKVCVNVVSEEGNLEALSAERAGILNIKEVYPNQDLGGSDLSSFFLILALVSILAELGLILLR
ncbi:MAG: BatA domain-containing protein [candidate division WOR-3 bacterium]|nr:MAG: BatA domain-containing protein [candidate division WOR-3 bacterium]